MKTMCRETASTASEQQVVGYNSTLKSLDPAYRSFSPSEPYHQRDLEEARGTIRSIFCRDGFAVASFEWGAVAFPEELKEQLLKLVGRDVAILRFDGRYHCREV